ncbi:hypothetical protein [Streptomyces sp. 3N207]|uniref:hypothetical protein n=1 Tax=Streptomyces sp. 3N207 TaxID=3457417 RepID=UPI003FD2F327
MRLQLRRLGSRAATAAGAVLALSFAPALVPPPAVAAPGDGEAAVTLEGPQPTRYLDEYRKGKDQPEQGFGFLLKGKGHTQQVTVRIDTGGLSGVAEVSGLSKHCHRDGKERIECSYRAKESGTAVQPLEISTARGSEVRDRGKITVAATAGPDDAPVRRTTDLVVGVPRFEVSGKFDRERQQPGGKAQLRLSVRASGPVRAANGVGLTMEPKDGMLLSPLYRNCGATAETHEMTLCKLEGRAPDPGETAMVDRPVGFHVPRDILYTGFDHHAYAIGAPDDPDLNPRGSYRYERKRWHDWRDGKPDAPTLRLRPGKAAGLGPFRKHARLTVKVDNHLDVAALGTTVRGKEGETVEVPIRVRERWPDGNKASTNYVEYTYRFTAPKGTTVVGVPEDSGEPMCSLRDHRRTVHCPGNMDGEEIRLRIDREVPGAVGRVAIHHSDTYSARDPERANDTDSVPLRVSGVTTELRARRVAADALPWAVGSTALLVAAGAAYWFRRRAATG